MGKPNPARDLAEQLRAPLVDLPPGERTPAQQATALLAAALEYHRREVLPFWWDHFRRVGAPVEDWEHDGEMIVLDPARITDPAGWHHTGKRFERTFQAVVDLPSSFKLLPGERTLFALYDAPVPSHAAQPVGSERGYATSVTFDAAEPVGEACRVTITERLPGKVGELGPEHVAYPAAVSADGGLEGKPMARPSSPSPAMGSGTTAPSRPSRRSTCSSACHPAW